MGVVRNNAIGNFSVSSAALSRQFTIAALAGGATFTSSALLVQGLPRIQIQAASNGANANAVEVTLQGAITQSGTAPEFFDIGKFVLVTGAAAPSLFFEYNAAVEFIRVVCINGVGAAVDFKIRLMACQ